MAPHEPADHIFIGSETVMKEQEDKYQNNTDQTNPNRTLKTKIRKIVPILVVLIGSFIAGFAAVYTLCHSRTPSNAVSPSLLPAVPNSTDTQDLSEISEVFIDTVDEDAAQNLEGDMPPEVPPGRIPDGVSIDKAPLYFKCWDSDGTTHRDPDCDTLEIFEKRFESRLYIVDRCKRQHAGETTEGKLSLGVQVDFNENSVSFWSGPSSELENAEPIGTCVRRELSRLPISGIEHKFIKYRLFFTVEFRDPERVQKELNKLKKRGRTVDVKMDHVRVRRLPEDGFVIGKISRDSQVIFVKKKGDWCHVVTPNDNEGWIICDALGL
jgi:hypothetical protein